MKVRMTGFTINEKELDKQIGNSKRFQQEARNLVNNQLNKAKANMIQEFNAHPVTQELEAGPDGQNMSGTLGGYGNLFSFMGFRSSDNPTKAVRAFLQSFVKIKKETAKGSLTRDFIIDAPTISDFGFARMPWESGNSWVKSIETGMSSFSYYMHKAYQASRAGIGMQIDNKLHSTSSMPKRYMSLILENFRKRLTK